MCVSVGEGGTSTILSRKCELNCMVCLQSDARHPEPHGTGRRSGEGAHTAGKLGFVDTYGAAFGRDLEPTTENGDYLYQLATACIKLYRTGARSCTDSGNICCQGGGPLSPSVTAACAHACRLPASCIDADHGAWRAWASTRCFTLHEHYSYSQQSWPDTPALNYGRRQ